MRAISTTAAGERRIAPVGTLPKWSPDGTRLAIIEISEYDAFRVRLVVVDRAGRARRVLGSRETEHYEPTWTPDGLAVALADPVVRLYPIDGSPPRSIVPSVGLAVGLSFAPDGASFVSWTSDCHSTLVIVAVTSATVQRLGRDCLLMGTDRDDVLTAPDFFDEIRGGADGGEGDDRIRLLGRSFVDGGPGDDRIDAAGTILGGPGNDRIHAWGRLRDTVRCGTP